MPLRETYAGILEVINVSDGDNHGSAPLPYLNHMVLRHRDSWQRQGRRS